ncbi:MAG: hypothetical protein IPK08_11405 [Bacteroidetes bacterium]|nr:hypothetical protein [Bacteroidota bacterium]
MKKYILPIILFICGAGMFAFTSFTSGSVDDLEVKIENTPVVMPSCYKVYGNPDALSGRYFLFKMLITNKGSRPVRNIRAIYEIPKFIEETEMGKISVLNPGQSVVVACYPVFNDDIVNKTTSSKEKTKIKLATSGGDREEEFGFEMKGRNEFLYTCVKPEEIRSYRDMFDNDPLIACYVTPEDPIIKYYTQQMQQKVLKGETAAVTNDPKEAVRMLMGVYQATYLSGMVYSGTSGVPSKFDDLQSMVQSLRLPREVVTGNTGLCIELSILYASVLMAAGLDPVIFLIPGHAYPGIVFQGQYYAIEATMIGGEGMGGRQDAQAAIQKGMKQLEEFIQAAQMGDERYSLINIRDMIAQQIRPMELKDDQFLREKIEKIAAGWENGAWSNDVQTSFASNTGGGNTGGGNEGGGGGGGGGASNGMTAYSGNVSFNYPAQWSRRNNPAAQYLPQLIHSFQPADNLASIQVYQVQGAANPNQAMQIIQQQLYPTGQEVQFQSAGNAGGYEIFNGITYSSNGSFQWQAFMKRAGGGVAGVIMGAGAGGEQYNGILNQVKSSIR